MIKKSVLVLATIIFTVGLIPSALALEVSIPREVYYEGEVFQAEINCNFVENPTAENIAFIRNGKEKFIPFHIIPVSSDKVFVWAKIGDEENGNYIFSVKGLLCREEVLEEGKAEKNFSVVEPLIKTYSELKEGYFSFDIEDNSFSLIALKNEEGAKNSLETSLLDKISDKNVKNDALALLALKKIGVGNTNWIEDAQNSIKGTWDLKIESSSKTNCSLKINDEEKILEINIGVNNFPLNLPDEEMIEIKTCNIPAKLMHVFKGEVVEFNFDVEGGENYLAIDNSGCFGSSYKSACNATTTAYAVWLLEDEKAKAWLVSNARTTEEKAIAYLLTKDETTRQWLENNQHKDGYWGGKGLAETSFPEFKSSVLASYALNSSKGKEWIREYHNDNELSLGEKAIMFALVFPYDELENVLTIEPGIIKTKNRAENLEISSVIGEDVAVRILKEGKKIWEKEISVNGYKREVGLEIPSVEKNTLFSVEVEAKKRVYTIPLMVFPSAVVNASKEVMSNVSVVPSRLRFSEENLALSGDDYRKARKVKIRNYGGKTEVEITLSLGIAGYVNVSPLSFVLEKGEEKEIEIVLEKAGDTEGRIQAKGRSVDIAIPVTISAGEMIPEEISEEETCESMGGIICYGECDYNTTTQEGVCCFSECRRNKKQVGVIIAMAVVLIIAFIIMRFRKQDKKEMKDVLVDIEKRQRERYKRS